jgi:biotin transport system substrate-specific component
MEGTVAMTHDKPLLDVLIPDSATPAGRLAANVFMAVLGSLLIAASAKVKVPFYPVPMTMQTLTIMLLAAAYGWKLGIATMGLYMLEGAMGLPVFAGTPERGIGLAYMAGPTGGYLIGYWLAAGVVGWLAEHGFGRNPVRLAGAMALSMVLVFGLGAAWLAQFTGLEKAFAVGVTPFVLGDVVKVAAAAAIVTAAWRGIGGRG